MRCVITITVSFLLNGKVCRSVVPSRGLKQAVYFSGVISSVEGKRLGAVIGYHKSSFKKFKAYAASSGEEVLRQHRRCTGLLRGTFVKGMRGGYGVPGSQCFNCALLAKQGWGMIKNPTSLVANVLSNGFYKLNSYMALDERNLMVGLGLVIRDCKGSIMVASTQCIQACYSPLIAEAVAILCGVIFAIEMRLVTIIVEFNALGMVKLANVEVFFY
ncbi:hypothetical protein Ddye_002406 [Dipteronia dyeriana]|uniref:RNase H type-1 domain-containing protein n=1 Tax=Dipteronia dyeriana TaxID=168575 RepID=A0AAD9XQV9_9ROSI|nr:hypothetical protein Ddye_002406 [Dipteronia dyeriana]